MSGLIAKLKSMISPDRAEKAADTIEQNVTDQRVDDALKRVPGGDKVGEHVPDNVGEKAADATRDTFGKREP
jgi:hypothetical protein